MNQRPFVSGGGQATWSGASTTAVVPAPFLRYRGSSCAACCSSACSSPPPAPALAQARDLPRTPWGAPDLSGYWEYRSTTSLERPEALAGREVLTAAEEAEYLAGRHAAIRRERDLQLNADWWQPGGLTDAGRR